MPKDLGEVSLHLVIGKQTIFVQAVKPQAQYRLWIQQELEKLPQLLSGKIWRALTGQTPSGKRLCRSPAFLRGKF